MIRDADLALAGAGDRPRPAAPPLDRRVLAHLPDVVVVNVGWIECQPRVMPTALLRWLYAWRPSLNPL